VLEKLLCIGKAKSSMQDWVKETMKALQSLPEGSSSRVQLLNESDRLQIQSKLEKDYNIQVRRTRVWD